MNDYVHIIYLHIFDNPKKISINFYQIHNKMQFLIHSYFVMYVEIKEEILNGYFTDILFQLKLEIV